MGITMKAINHPISKGVTTIYISTKSKNSKSSLFYGYEKVVIAAISAFYSSNAHAALNTMSISEGEPVIVQLGRCNMRNVHVLTINCCMGTFWLMIRWFKYLKRAFV